jgi:hypothetical protein
MNHTLKTALTANAKELKNQNGAKAKRIVIGVDMHLRSSQAARKIDNAVVGGRGSPTSPRLRRGGMLDREPPKAGGRHQL